MDHDAKKLGDCQGLEFMEKSINAKYCCYSDLGDLGGACLPLTEEDYKDQDGFLKRIESENIKVYKLVCISNSNYYKISLLILLSLLLILL